MSDLKVAPKTVAHEGMGGAVIDLVKVWIQKLIENADKIDEVELAAIVAKAEEVYAHLAAGQTLKAMVDAAALIKLVKAALKN